MIQKFGDYAIEFTERTSNDEYHRLKTHESSTVALWAMPLTMFLGAAILAWTLPGWYSTLGAGVIILCTAATQQAGLQWMRGYAPRPKTASPPPYMAAALLLVLAMLAGVIWNAALSYERSWPLAFGILGSAVIGVILALTTVPRSMSRQHEKDIARIEAGLED
ncbi:hypothetical protein [Corynebacterium cystitidis]|uniref:Uncharacterized protein n=1 Tax=Corynebacterium cystitidis DSM 20524 TaxID=1121357 RepID=A0A1H9P2F5_9CORY|nr:hypothetical protein [Corynebacterium cystitidis]WJY82660.1 hypothetical protein CCYS_08720 [Corynebacterium cystitidis DSM 20524]SER41753.1 hypothetical protein SAMN05661109_00173 [Corynebacterium cystitidis DSM 20524]SNV72172.1 Uncharacterised protein [Corynebacterium cystitidis]